MDDEAEKIIMELKIQRNEIRREIEEIENILGELKSCIQENINKNKNNNKTLQDEILMLSMKKDSLQIKLSELNDVYDKVSNQIFELENKKNKKEKNEEKIMELIINTCKSCHSSINDINDIQKSFKKKVNFTLKQLEEHLTSEFHSVTIINEKGEVIWTGLNDLPNNNDIKMLLKNLE
jgi:chromosome segregation ATPase